MQNIYYRIFISAAIVFFILAVELTAQVKTGADILLSEKLYLTKGKRIGIICNHTSLLSNGTHLIDALINQQDQKVTAIFTPEHGFKGSAEAGEVVDYKNDRYKNIPVISLYGNDKKPTKNVLDDVDILIFDIQDVGARFYTYISTLFYCLESAAENDKEIIVLDRPNPIGCKYVDGPVLENKFRSFVGIAPLPVTHGMTVGELAMFFTGEKLISAKGSVKLEVVRCSNWHREINAELFVNWISPSPNINSFETAITYAGTCLLEGTNISEGRGTNYPFLQIGAPFINSNNLCDELNQLKITGAEFEPVSFVPVDIKEMASNPKFENEKCNGIKISITNPAEFESVKFSIKLLSILVKLYGDKIKFNESSFDRLAGNDDLRKQLLKNTDTETIFDSWQIELNKFKEKRNNYLLY